MQTSFTIRVYAILKNRFNEVLLSKEKIKGTWLQKFPGGGLEFGEGTIDALIRELKEELAIPFKKNDFKHFYTTDFFQPSMFNESIQVISIYYLNNLTGESSKLINHKIAHEGFPLNNITFHWSSIDNDLIHRLSLPIDKKVAKMLIKNL